MTLTLDAPTARRLLAGARVGVGALAVLAPKLTGKLVGVDPEANPAAVYMTRMFGARELFMASPFLLPAPGLDEAELAQRGIPVDAIDLAAALLAGLSGALPMRAALPAAGAAAGGVALGVIASRDA